jgi:hypothetical protein
MDLTGFDVWHMIIKGSLSSRAPFSNSERGFSESEPPLYWSLSWIKGIAESDTNVDIKHYSTLKKSQCLLSSVKLNEHLLLIN